MKKALFKRIALDMTPYILVLGVSGAIAYAGYKTLKKATNAIDDINWDEVFKNL